MTGTGWKEEASGREAETLPVPTGAVERVPAAPAGAVLRREAPLHERGAEGEASPDNPEFLRYLIAVEDATGKKVNRRSETALAPLREAFAKRAETAALLSGFFGGEAQKILGADFSSPELSSAVSAHLEALSQTNPKKVAEYHALFSEAVAAEREIQEMEARKSRLVSGEELREASAQYDEKKKVLELAKASNRFFGGWGRLTSVGAWVREVVGKKAGAEELREQKKARQKAQRMGYGSKILGTIKHQEAPFLRFVIRGTKVERDLADIAQKVQEISVEKAGDLRVAEQFLLQKKARLAEMKRALLAESAMRDEAAALMRKGAAGVFGDLFRHMETAPARTEELEKFVLAEETLGKIVAAAESGEDALDAARELGDAKTLRQKIHEGAEALARRVIARKLQETLAEPHSPGRFSALLRELSELSSREKVGRHKGALAVKGFIAAELRQYLERDISAALAYATSDTERESIRLRAEVLEHILVQLEPPPREAMTEAARALSAADSRRGGEDEGGGEPPAAPSGGAGETPPGAPPAPSGGGETVVFDKEKTDSTGFMEKVQSAVARLPGKAEGGEAQTAEGAAHLTFGDALKVREEALREALSQMTMDTVTIALADELPDMVEYVRGLLTPENQPRFDNLRKFGPAVSAPIIADAREEFTKEVEKVFFAKGAAESREEQSTEAAEAIETEPPEPAAKKQTQAEVQADWQAEIDTFLKRALKRVPRKRKEE